MKSVIYLFLMAFISLTLPAKSISPGYYLLFNPSGLANMPEQAIYVDKNLALLKDGTFDGLNIAERNLSDGSLPLATSLFLGTDFCSLSHEEQMTRLHRAYSWSNQAVTGGYTFSDWAWAYGKYIAAPTLLFTLAFHLVQINFD